MPSSADHRPQPEFFLLRGIDVFCGWVGNHILYSAQGLYFTYTLNGDPMVRCSSLGPLPRQQAEHIPLTADTFVTAIPDLDDRQRRTLHL